MQKKFILILILCFNLLMILIQKDTSLTMAQNQNICNSCPKGMTLECKTEWNIAKKGVCQSDEEWYFYELLESAPGASIIITPEQGTDVNLYVMWDKSCPSSSKYDCVSNSAGLGKPEECHHIFTNFNSPNYFLVRRVSGSGCYSILLSRYKSASTKTTGLTTMPYTTIKNNENLDDKIGENNLSVFIIILIIITIAVLVVKFKSKH